MRSEASRRLGRQVHLSAPRSPAPPARACADVSAEAMAERLARVITPPATAIADALSRLDRAGTGVLLLSDNGRTLFGVLSDGDIRRHIMAGGSLDEACASIATRQPLVARPDMAEAEILDLLDHSREYVINHVPLLDDARRIVGLVLRSDLVRAEARPLSAVIMAGGFGTRLRPLTETMPKPMLPVGDRPLLERMVERLRSAGIHRISITTHYLGDKIISHFGDGRDFGVDLRYVPEDKPMGTAGGLRLMEPTDEPILVINGDILTSLDARDMLAFHREHAAVATVGVRQYEMEVPYGVIESDGAAIRAVREKPVHRFFVNAGIYLLEPAALHLIPADGRFDMTDLITQLVAQGRVVVSFPIVEYWLDIGRAADYQQAQEDIRRSRI